MQTKPTLQKDKFHRAAEFERDGIPPVEALHNLAERCPLVGTIMKQWRRGTMSFEQALVQMVLTLSSRNDEMQRSAFPAMRMRMPAPPISEDPNFLTIPESLRLTELTLPPLPPELMDDVAKGRVHPRQYFDSVGISFDEQILAMKKEREERQRLGLDPKFGKLVGVPIEALRADDIANFTGSLADLTNECPVGDGAARQAAADEPQIRVGK